MTILQINKYFYRRGGADAVMIELSKLLEERGQNVVPFAMNDAKNLPTAYAHSFVSYVETEKVIFGWQGLRTAGRMLYSCEAKRKISSLIKTTKPDIAHIHNIYHQISPSIFGPLRKNKIPTVMTVHDWSLISPNYNLFDHGKICELGIKNPWAIIKRRCVKNSFAASLYAAFVFSIHKLLKLYERGIDKFIAPSDFVKNKLVENGFSENKIEVIPHFVKALENEPYVEGNYIGYIGRLSGEKGLPVLIEAAKSIPEVLIKIAGTGPEEKKIKDLVEKEGITNIEFIGRLDGAEKERFYRNSMAIVVPSVWYEIFGMVVIEAYAAKKPVIASNVGGLSEVVRDGETGFLFPLGDAAALAQKIKIIINDKEKRRAMGERGYQLALEEYNPEAHYKKIIGVYESLKHESTEKTKA